MVHFNYKLFFTFLVDDGSMCWKLLEETGLVGRLEEGLAAEPVEWKRSFGRTAKSVTVRAKLAQSADHFRALQDQAVPTKLIGHPVLHTFWTDCQDLDAYKSGVAGSVKDEISRWLQMLKQVWGSSTATESWMVVVVETNSQVHRHDLPQLIHQTERRFCVQEGMARKSSKLLLQRTSVVDKIKADFAGGKQDKCLTLIGELSCETALVY